MIAGARQIGDQILKFLGLFIPRHHQAKRDPPAPDLPDHIEIDRSLFGQNVERVLSGFARHPPHAPTLGIPGVEDYRIEIRSTAQHKTRSRLE